MDPIAKSSILPASATAERTGPSALEEEVVQLFDQLRAPVLRYLLSLGLAVQDGEEIAQEVFWRCSGTCGWENRARMCMAGFFAWPTIWA